MAVGQGGGLGAPRVHDHQPPAARAQLLQAALHTRRGHEAAVRGQRVGAQHQQIVRAVDVGYGQQQLMAEHQQRGQHVRQLVRPGVADNRAVQPRETGPVHRRACLSFVLVAARAQRAREQLAVEDGAVVVHGRVALVERHRAASLRALDVRQAPGGLLQRLLPADLLPFGAHAAQRTAQPVRILVQVLEGDRLGADVPAAEHVVGVSADGPHDTVLDVHRDAAHRLAQVASAKVPLRAHRPRPLAMISFMISLAPPPMERMRASR